MLSRVSTASLIALVLAATFGRFSTALAQVVAAIYLSPRDFGVYATAVGIVLVTTGMRGGGTGNHLQTMTLPEFQESGWRIFRFAQTFTLIGVTATLLVAWPAATWFAASKGYPIADLLKTVLLLAANFILFNLSWYGRCKLVAAGGLSKLSGLDAGLGFVKFLSTWVLAASGFGPLALAGALTLGGILENIWVWSGGMMSLDELRGKGIWLRATAREMSLPLVMAILTTLASQTDAMIGSLFLPVTVLGFYYFGMQLASQPAMVVGSSIRAVFTSMTASVRGDATLERRALQTTFNGAMVFLPIATMFIPAVFEPFEIAMWNGRWANARWPVMLLSIATIYSTALQLAGAPVAGARNWKLAIRLDTLRAMSKIIGAVVGGLIALWLQMDAVMAGITLAAAVGGASTLVSIFELYRLMRAAEMPRGSIFYELYSTPLAAILSAVAAVGLAHSVTEPLRTMLPIVLAAGIECVLAATIYTVLSFLLLRFGYTPTLERLLQGIPDPIARPLRRVFFLPIEAA